MGKEKLTAKEIEELYNKCSDEDKEKLLKKLNSYQGEAKETIKDEKKVNKLVEKALELCKKLSNLPLVGSVFEDIPLICYIISDYANGNYKEIPMATIVTLTCAVLYFISPVDIIPDNIPVVGYVDDLVVIKLALNACHNDLMSYKEWKEVREASL